MNKLLKIGAAALLSIATLAGCASGSKEENSEKPTESAHWYFAGLYAL